MKNFKKFKKIADIAFVSSNATAAFLQNSISRKREKCFHSRIQLPELEYRTYFLRLALQP
mgnify:CR=1 FL=1